MKGEQLKILLVAKKIWQIINPQKSELNKQLKKQKETDLPSKSKKYLKRY